MNPNAVPLGGGGKFAFGGEVNVEIPRPADNTGAAAAAAGENMGSTTSKKEKQSDPPSQHA